MQSKQLAPEGVRAGMKDVGPGRALGPRPSSRRAPIARVESGSSGGSIWNWSGGKGRKRSPSPEPPSAPAGPAPVPNIGKRMLNLGPNASPAAIAAALAEATRVGHRPLQPISAAFGDGSYASGNGMGAGNGSNGRGGASGVISVAELDNMLHGLRTNLASIQESRAQYVTLLRERDATISSLQTQLDSAMERMQELENQLYSSSLSSSETASGDLLAMQARAEAAEARAAHAEAQVEDMSARAAVSEQRAIEYEAIAEELEGRATKAEARAATAEAKAMVTQELLQQQAEELEEAKAVAARLEAQMATVPVAPPPPPPPPPPTYQPNYQPNYQPQQSPPPRSSPPPQPRVMNEIMITYRTSWKQVYIHCNMDNKGWTTIPGLPMDNVGSDLKVIRLPCQRVEFVYNNGKGEWDSNNNQNYHIYTPGNYRMEHGSIQRVQ